MTPSLNAPATVTRTRLRTRLLHATAVGLCLTGSLAGLAACSDRADGSEGAGQASGSSALSEATARPSITQSPLSPAPTASGAAGGLSTRSSDAASVQPTATWTPPEVHFYNENWNYWYQDDSVTNQDSITSQGNLEGFRTYSGRCAGFATRDINEATRFSGLDDEFMSSLLLDGSANMDTFTETSRERVSLVRDDGGTMEGYNISYTGTYTWAEGPGDVSGYRFARTVGDSGLNFVVMIMCEAGEEPTVDQWHEILAGMRLTGVSAGTMEE